MWGAVKTGAGSQTVGHRSRVARVALGGPGVRCLHPDPGQITACSDGRWTISRALRRLDLELRRLDLGGLTHRLGGTSELVPMLPVLSSRRLPVRRGESGSDVSGTSVQSWYRGA